MKKLDIHPPLTYQTDAQSVVSTFPPIPVDTTLRTGRRLIVLVPADIDHNTATRRIWELAHATGMSIQLLSLCKEADEEPALRRRLITMASLLQDGETHAQANVELGTNWVHALKAHHRAGDVVVCFEEQKTGLLRRPLSQVLASNLKITVCILSSLTPQRPKTNLLSQLSRWLGYIGIIIVFGILQANIVQLREGGLQNTLLILSIIPEFWLIWVWGDWFG